ncbi:MAG: PH domain-containing protein [Muribaculum sp.]|nr:PH domain-containing protein [Muribaculum sp.]
MSTIYKSKIDSRIMLVVVLVVLIQVVPLLYFAFSWVAVIISLCSIVFIIYCFYSTKYIIKNNELHIKTGFFLNQKLKVSEIVKIENTNNILSAPAASLDRLAIYLKKQHTPIIISPKNKEEFLNEVCTINPNILIKTK